MWADDAERNATVRIEDCGCRGKAHAVDLTFFLRNTFLVAVAVLVALSAPAGAGVVGVGIAMVGGVGTAVVAGLLAHRSVVSRL